MTPGQINDSPIPLRSVEHQTNGPGAGGAPGPSRLPTRGAMPGDYATCAIFRSRSLTSVRKAAFSAGAMTGNLQSPDSSLSPLLDRNR